MHGRKDVASEVVPALVKRAFAARRRERAVRCRRAVLCSRTAGLGLGEADIESRSAWKLRVEQSREFVANLDST